MHVIRRCRDGEIATILAIVNAAAAAYRDVIPTSRRLLVGTWADAAWAIRFYQREGFALVPPTRAAELLKSYWNIPYRQIESSVVLERGTAADTSSAP